MSRLQLNSLRLHRLRFIAVWALKRPWAWGRSELNSVPHQGQQASRITTSYQCRLCSRIFRSPFHPSISMDLTLSASGMPHVNCMTLEVVPSVEIERAPMSSEDDAGDYQDMLRPLLQVATRKL